MSAVNYFAYKHKLVPDIMKAYNALAAENDIIERTEHAEVY